MMMKLRVAQWSTIRASQNPASCTSGERAPAGAARPPCHWTGALKKISHSTAHSKVLTTLLRTDCWNGGIAKPNYFGLVGTASQPFSV